MLLKDFYSLTADPEPLYPAAPSGTMQQRQLSVRLNPDHPVYRGHFPGNPVVPGVCQIMMIKELTGMITGRNLTLDHADNIKFLSLIVPEKNPVLDFNLSVRESESETISVNASIRSGETVFLKFKGSFSLI